MQGVFKNSLKAKIISQNKIGTIKSTNFGAVSIVEQVVCVKSYGNIKDAHGQA